MYLFYKCAFCVCVIVKVYTGSGISFRGELDALNIRRCLGWSAFLLPTKLCCCLEKRPSGGGTEKKSGEDWSYWQVRKSQRHLLTLDIKGKETRQLWARLSWFSTVYGVNTLVTLLRERHGTGKGLLPVCWRIQFGFSERRHSQTYPCSTPTR